MSWTDETIAVLRERWERGETATTIADALGDGFTRNAVIAKAHKLDLHARTSPTLHSELNKDRSGKHGQEVA